MAKENVTCILCGEKYEYCPSCRSALTTPRWKSLFDSENCKTIFETTSNFLQNGITKDEAKAILENCDLNRQYRFSNQVRGAIKDIMYQPPVIQEVVEDAEVEEPVLKYVPRKKK